MCKTGADLLCVNVISSSSSNSQIYHLFTEDDKFATKISDLSYQWTSLSFSQLLQPLGSITVLAGTYNNGMFISS